MAEVSSNKTNQAPTAAATPKPSPAVPASTSSSSSSNAPKSNPSLPPKVGDLPGMNFLKSPVILLVVIAVIVIIAFVAFFAKRLNVPSKPASMQATVSSPVVGASPLNLPAVKEQGDIQILSDFFTNSSASFKSEYMQKIPQQAAESYKKYVAETNEEAKLEMARNFYIYLNNPAAASDEEYQEFLEDVKSALEESLGKELF